MLFHLFVQKENKKLLRINKKIYNNAWTKVQKLNKKKCFNF